MGEFETTRSSTLGFGPGSRPLRWPFLWRALRLSLPLGLFALLLAGCASSAPPSGAPTPQTVTAATPTPEPAREASPQQPPAPRASPVPPRTVVIEPGGDETAKRSGLAAAAEAERQRRQAAGPSVIAIDDENLASYAEGAKLSYTKDSLVTQGSTAVGEVSEASGEASRDESWWRQRVRDLRLDWREAEEEILELERRVSDLRYRFYAEDDPYTRDGTIKPSWDQALEALEEARRASRRAERRLDEALEEGTREGALPGWLREGMELEPERRAAERPAAQSDEGELVIVEPNTEEDGWR